MTLVSYTEGHDQWISVWDDVWLMEKNGGAHIVQAVTPSLLRCGRLTPTFEDGDEAVKMLDENVDERKKNATSWDEMWRGATCF